MGSRKGRDSKYGDLADYLEFLTRSYGDLDDPKWFFVREAMDRNPYSELFRELSSLGAVIDDTDINCDVCFTFTIQSEQYLTVRLSMVGPYAVVFASGSDGHGPLRLLETASQYGTTSEALIIDIVSRHNLKILSERELRRRIPIRLREGTPDSSLYAAFFEPDSEAF
ncbi:hypothetical protein [Nonomuraea polychroma]|uniref:hypothetical protein n=1 Tax=Nonomuraea polychroma TaxID=46176 RepID=UPI000FDE8D83|nr:hypothetical protein [Nonomuraea polychroma]